MIPNDRSERGFTLVAALPWLIAAGSLAISAVWVQSVSGPEASDPAAATDSQKVKTLQLALTTAQSENDALRRELDRLLEDFARDGAVKATSADAANGPDGAAPRDVSEVDALAKRARDLLADGLTPEAAQALTDLANSGPSAHPILTEIYQTSADPAVKKLLFPALTFVGGREKGIEFVAGELDRGADPEMKNRLLLSATTFVDRSTAPMVKDHLVRAIQDPEVPEALQQRAVRGLGHVKGPEAESVLFDAAGNRSERVRAAAYAELARRPGARERLRQMLASDPSPLSRELGQCQLLIAENR